MALENLLNEHNKETLDIEQVVTVQEMLHQENGESCDEGSGSHSVSERELSDKSFTDLDENNDDWRVELHEWDGRGSGDDQSDE